MGPNHVRVESTEGARFEMCSLFFFFLVTVYHSGTVDSPALVQHIL